MNSKKSNIVTKSYFKKQIRRDDLRAQAKREREGRKIGFLNLSNQFRDNYPIIKWDFLFNLIIFTGVLWANEYIFLGIIVFLQIYIASYFIFNYRKYRLAPFIGSFSIIPFSLYFLFSDSPIAVRNGFLFIGWAIISYGFFWILIVFKNRREFKEAQKKEVCLVCNQPKEKFKIHLGRFLCEDCYLEEAYLMEKYHDVEVFKWDYEILNFFEKEIGERIPKYDLINDLDILKPDLVSKLFFCVEHNNITVLSIPNKGLKFLPEEIGLLISLQVLNFPGNNISRLPYAFEKLYHLKVLNLEYNQLEFLPSHSLKTLTLLKRRNCKILK